MAGRSTLDREVAFFAAPQQANHRRYEALRAVFVEGLSHAEAGERFGYTRAAMASLVRDWRAGKLDLFAPPRKPGPATGTAPARERVRGRIVALRRQGLSVYEVSARLAAEGTPLKKRPPRRPPLAATPPCPRSPRWTSPPCPTGVTRPWPACCWSCPTCSPWTCPPWSPPPVTPAPAPSPRSAGCCRCCHSNSPAPAGSATSMTTFSSTPPAPCSPAWPCYPRRPP